jgi:hydrogenase maturation protease
MKDSLVKSIADAVLYEGYLLYPYRPSAVKNQQRWNFGALCPESYSLAQAGTESWTMQTQVLIEAGPNTKLNVAVRFLHLLNREVAQVVADCHSPIAECAHRELESFGGIHLGVVAELDFNSRLFQPLQEAVEREVCLPQIELEGSAIDDTFHPFSFPALETFEPLNDESTTGVVGALIRRQETINGVVEVRVERCELRNPVDEESPNTSERQSGKNSKSNQLHRITVQIRNLTPFEDAGKLTRDDSLMRSLVSTHTILTVENGELVSLLDPPEKFREAAAGCSNVGTYPVLVGEEGTRDCMLSSPIILYDYPQIAPESPGSLFDGTEIDEILTLRIMTLTDEEKREMRNADDRARQILERTESLPVEQFMKMHGAMKGVNRKS